MNREAMARLRAMAADVHSHVAARSVRLADAIGEIDSTAYTDPDRFERELKLLFRRVPLMLAASCEIAAPGQYKTMDVAGVPVVLVRGKDGQARAFLNACSHRASPVARDCGNVARFTCPYHGWSFGLDGSLLAIASRAEFGEVDKATLALKPLPLHERSGLIWVTLDPDTKLGFERFLCGLDEALAGFDLENWQVLRSVALEGGANWKLAFDAHIDWYHLPVLHGQSFGTQTCNRALYYYWGPHQRLISPEETIYPVPVDVDFYALAKTSLEQWPVGALMPGLWTSFPNVSLTQFYDGGHGLLISQVFPGASVDRSITVQTYLMAGEPDDGQRSTATGLCEFLEKVVRDEDLWMSHEQQKVLASGLVDKVRLGRNEEGIQEFHRWIDAILATGSDRLETLFDGQPVE